MSRVVRSDSAGGSGSSGPSCLSARRGPSALSGLSDRELLVRVKALVSQERATTLEILVHLIEVERRKLHLRLGYPSLFEYCTRHLGYSSSAAGRRIHAARCVRDFPEVYGLLKKNEVNLSSVSLVASILTTKNKDDLLGRIRNKSQKEVEGIVSDYRPPVSFRDRARPVCVAVAEPPQKTAGEFWTSLSTYSRSGSEISPNVAGGCVAEGCARGQSGASTEKRALLAVGNNAPVMLNDDPVARDAMGRSSATSGPTAPSHDPTTLGAGALTDRPTARVERKLLVQFLASEAFMKKFEKARALLSNRLGKPSYEAVLETALDEFLAHRDPETRERRREEREHEAVTRRIRKRSADPEGEGQQQARTEQRREAPEPIRRVPSESDRSRHVPAAARNTVFARDSGQCAYVGSTGKRCGSTRNLQIDHIVPFGRGGTHALSNLRLLCGKHNRLEAERVFGVSSTRRGPLAGP